VTVTEVWPRPGAEPDLLERYPRSPEPTLRVNFVTSLDGAVTVDGFSAGLSGPGDKLIFGHLRKICDALIVAAGTVRTENYDALRLDVSSRTWRTEHGLPEFPLMVVVSVSRIQPRPGGLLGRTDPPDRDHTRHRPGRAPRRDRRGRGRDRGRRR
jgi:hypothetical protein